MVDFTTFVLLAFSIFIIFKSSEWVIRYALSLSKIIGVSTFVIGFILIAVSTSLPEIFVTLFASLQQEPNLAIGNILGSNLFDINVIIGLTTLLVGTIYMKRKETLQLIELLFITSTITLVIFSLPTLGPVHGIVLLILFGYLMVKLYKGGKIEKEVFKEEKIPSLPRKPRILEFLRKKTWPVLLLKFAVSIAILLAGTRILVDTSLDLAGFLGLSTTFIGATIVAAGTSLPELSVTFAAVKKRHYALAMGSLIGSAVTNITLVLGILSLVTLAPINLIPLVGLLPILIISTLVIWYAFNTKRKVTKNTGILLLVLYAVFIFEQLGIIAIFG